MQAYSNTLKIHQRVMSLIFLIGLTTTSLPSFAESNTDLPSQAIHGKVTPLVGSPIEKKETGLTIPEKTRPAPEKIIPVKPQPFTQAEIHQGLQDMQQRMVTSIEAWGDTLKPEDFERSWTGRQLNKAKRQEVCGIYQAIVNDTFRMAVENKARLSQSDQSVLSDRNVFIQSLGFKGNIVDTQMGFNCRLK